MTCLACVDLSNQQAFKRVDRFPWLTQLDCISSQTLCARRLWSSLVYHRGIPQFTGFHLFVAFFLCEQALQRSCAVGEPLKAGAHQLSLRKPQVGQRRIFGATENSPSLDPAVGRTRHDDRKFIHGMVFSISQSRTQSDH